MKKLEIVRKIEEIGASNASLLQILKCFVAENIEERKYNDDIQNLVGESLQKTFLHKFREKFIKHNRTYERLFKNEQTWLNTDFHLISKLPEQPSTSGRKEKPFESCAPRTKRRKVASLTMKNPTEALALAAKSRARSSPGKKDLSFVIAKSLKSPDEVRKKIDQKNVSLVTMTSQDALAMKISADLSDDQYQIIRNSAMMCNANIYPTLHAVSSAKGECYPENISITETSATSGLQEMLDHTLSRILKMTANSDNLTTDAAGTLFIKAGFDGASSQSIYNQKYEITELESAMKNEESLLQTAIVPLKLTIGNETIWQNSKPSSSKFCRPLHIQFMKETREVSVSEERGLAREIQELKPYSVPSTNVSIDYDVRITMLDGKAINALTNTASTQTCNVCKAKPSEMNDLEAIRQKTINHDSLQYGLSTLHCWIRCFEFCLHLGYKMEIKKFYARSDTDKKSVHSRKGEIQLSFRKKLNLVVDKPKQGYGNSNTGNTARRAFAASEIFSEITGVDLEIIERLRTILRAVCCGKELNILAFKHYCQETSAKIVERYDWYIMPPSVHKLLEHGYQIAENLELPMGFYSEEAQESQHKEIRKARLHHTCKISRVNALRNLYHHLLIMTDPIIASKKFSKHHGSADNIEDQELRSLLNVPGS